MPRLEMPRGRSVAGCSTAQRAPERRAEATVRSRWVAVDCASPRSRAAARANRAAVSPRVPGAGLPRGVHLQTKVLELQLDFANFAVLPWQEQHLPDSLLVLMLTQAAAQLPALLEPLALSP